jgi:TusE/DsrC/DsvC family sulfur relay protein
MKNVYNTDKLGFLLDSGEWDEGFARSAAPSVLIDDLTSDHWRVIRFIRDYYVEHGESPLVFIACRANDLSLRRMEELFPTGYQRGACKLAGVTYGERQINYFGEPGVVSAARREPAQPTKTYTVHADGFLASPSEWDETFAVNKALELKIGPFTDKHWTILHYLRDKFEKSGVIPTVYRTCEDNGVTLDELEHLFPAGYHRGAIKLAGLRLR